jgi:hypothetical protein
VLSLRRTARLPLPLRERSGCHTPHTRHSRDAGARPTLADRRARSGSQGGPTSISGLSRNPVDLTHTHVLQVMGSPSRPIRQIDPSSCAGCPGSAATRTLLPVRKIVSGVPGNSYGVEGDRCEGRVTAVRAGPTAAPILLPVPKESLILLVLLLDSSRQPPGLQKSGTSVVYCLVACYTISPLLSWDSLRPGFDWRCFWLLCYHAGDLSYTESGKDENYTRLGLTYPIYYQE